MNLMVSPANSGSVTSNFLERLPYFIAVACVVASGWYQMWQTQLRQKKLGSNQNNPMNKQMQMISRVFPIVFGWFSYIASSGLVLYFVTSSLWRIGQQHLVLNKYYEEQQAGSAGARRRRKRCLRPRPTEAPTNGAKTDQQRRGIRERRRAARAVTAHVPQEEEAQALNRWNGSKSRRRASTRPSSSRSTGSASSPTSSSTRSSTSPAAGCSGWVGSTPASAPG